MSKSITTLPTTYQKLTPGGTPEYETAEMIVDYEGNTRVDTFITNDPTLLISENALNQEIDVYKQAHKRPMNEGEYTKYLIMLRTSEDNGEFLYDHEKAAVARIIKENYMRFSPGSILPDIVENYVYMATKLSSDFKDHYLNALKKYRSPLTTDVAEREALTVAQKTVEYVPKKVTSQFSHPMLKVGLIKSRK